MQIYEIYILNIIFDGDTKKKKFYNIILILV